MTLFWPDGPGDSLAIRGARVIDPVRGITNLSSGKMGFALASAAREAGAEVTLVAGPVSLPTPRGVTRMDVKSAQDMLEAVVGQAQTATVLIAK